MSKIKQFYLIALLAVTAMAMLPISRASGVSSVDRSVAGVGAFVSYIEHEEDRQALLLDSQKAISLANHSPAFQAKIEGIAYQFNSIYEEFSWSPTVATPSVLMSTVNVVYSHDNSDGTGTNVVAVEDAALTKVVDVTVQSGMKMHTQYASSIWDGWEFSTSYGVFEAAAHWTVTHAYVPLNTVTGSNCNNHCDFSTWVGLAQNQGGSCPASSNGCIVQGGTDSGQSCGWFGCGPNNGGYYYPWYEFLPAGSVACGGTGGSNIHYGDSYSEDVYQFPGSSVYRISGNDYTTNYGCSSQALSYTYFTNQRNCYYSPAYACANYAEVIGEKPVGTTLPAFTQYTTSQCSIDPNYGSGGYNTCNNLASNEYNMQNCAYANVGHTYPSSSDAWNTWYNTSSCT